MNSDTIEDARGHLSRAVHTLDFARTRAATIKSEAVAIDDACKAAHLAIGEALAELITLAKQVR